MYECRADAKGRLKIPSGLKNQLITIVNEGVVLKRSVFNKCLELHPISQWEAVMEDVNKLNRFVKKNNDFIRMFTAGVRKIETDSTTRIQIPKDLIKFAGIKKEVVLASVGKIVEVWDKDRYEASVNNVEVDFGLLAEEVMGGSSKTKDND
jgi:MraZ protein